MSVNASLCTQSSTKFVIYYVAIVIFIRIGCILIKVLVGVDPIICMHSLFDMICIIFSSKVFLQCIKMSGSELQPRKVVVAFKKCYDCREYFTHNDGASFVFLLKPALLNWYSLVNSLYYISTKSVRFVHKSRNLALVTIWSFLPKDVHGASFIFFFLLLVKTFHGFHRYTFEYFSV